MICIKNLLYRHFPHRWLDKNKRGTKKLFDALGEGLDYVYEYVEFLRRNSKTRTAVELLPILEEEYGVKTETDIEIRRALIIAKKRMQDCPITKPDLLSILGAVGVTAEITHYYNQYAINFVIIDNNFELPMGMIISLINDNVRAHVDIWLKENIFLNTTLYTANHIESCAIYDLKTEIVGVSLKCVAYSLNNLETCQTYNLQL